MVFISGALAHPHLVSIELRVRRGEQSISREDRVGPGHEHHCLFHARQPTTNRMGRQEGTYVASWTHASPAVDRRSQ